MLEHECRCSKEVELAENKMAIAELSRRCYEKEKHVDELRTKTVPDIITHNFRPLLIRITMLEAWQKWTFFYVPTIIGLAIFILKSKFEG